MPCIPQLGFGWRGVHAGVVRAGSAPMPVRSDTSGSTPLSITATITPWPCGHRPGRLHVQRRPAPRPRCCGRRRRWRAAGERRSPIQRSARPPGRQRRRASDCQRRPAAGLPSASGRPRADGTAGGVPRTAGDGAARPLGQAGHLHARGSRRSWRTARRPSSEAGRRQDHVRARRAVAMTAAAGRRRSPAAGVPGDRAGCTRDRLRAVRPVRSPDRGAGRRRAGQHGHRRRWRPCSRRRRRRWRAAAAEQRYRPSTRRPPRNCRPQVVGGLMPRRRAAAPGRWLLFSVPAGSR